MQFDWTMPFAVVVTSGITLAIAWVGFRVRMALTEKRAQEAFEIAKLARDQIAELRVHIASGYVPTDRLREEIDRLDRSIGALTASVGKLPGEIAAAVASGLSRTRRRGTEEG